MEQPEHWSNGSRIALACDRPALLASLRAEGFDPGEVITLAKFLARKAIEKELQNHGFTIAHIESAHVKAVAEAVFAAQADALIAEAKARLIDYQDELSRRSKAVGRPRLAKKRGWPPCGYRRAAPACSLLRPDVAGSFYEVGSHGGQKQMGNPKRKAYIGYTSFFVALFSIVLFAPYDGWKLLLLFLAAIPFWIWVRCHGVVITAKRISVTPR